MTIIRYNSKSQIATKSAIVFAVVYNFYSFFKKQKANSNESYFQDYNSLKPQFHLLPVLHAREKNKNLKEEVETTIVDKETEVNFTGNNVRKQIFFQYASVEYNGIPYMTPQDFIDSITFGRSRNNSRRRKVLHKFDVDKYLKMTPSLKDNSPRLLRDLENQGLITYSEYLFLLCVITKPKSRFEIAFNMFDIDENKKVDKKEFLVIEKVFENSNENKISSKSSSEESSVTKIFQRDTERKIFKKGESGEWDDQDSKIVNPLNSLEVTEYVDTTLLVHLFGKEGKDCLFYKDFTKFMKNLQTEILEVEFNEFAKGLNKISELEFAEILLRYTEFDESKKAEKLSNLESEIEEVSRGITFESFQKFSSFMNNLEDFSLALKYHTYANKSISKNEFQRAVKLSSGFELDDQIVDVIFRVFDEDKDESLSYKEFIAVMKDRLRRNPKNKSSKQSFTQEFKSCIATKLREDQYY